MVNYTLFTYVMEYITLVTILLDIDFNPLETVNYCYPYSHFVYDSLTTTNNRETFLQYFLEILKQML